MEQSGHREAKERILNASIRLFSQKGFDGTSVSEIAEGANVTKALIYYYFKSKEEILDYLVQLLLNDMTSMTMDFIHANIVQFIRDGRLDIEPDRLRFADDGAIQSFLKNAYVYYERTLDYALENRSIIRILMLESLKDSKHQNKLFRLLDLTKDSEANPIFKTIYEADQDFYYSDDMVLFKFFFSIFPLISFVAYYDSYKELSGQGDEMLRESFLKSAQIISASLISGKDILLRNKNAMKGSL